MLHITGTAAFIEGEPTLGFTATVDSAKNGEFQVKLALCATLLSGYGLSSASY